MEISRGESMSDLDFGDPPWMYGNAIPTVVSPPRIAPAVPPPRPEDLDRVVQESLIQNLTERADLQQRIDRVHNAGEPDPMDTCGLAMKAFWAVPLVFLAKGIKNASKPLVGCCSVGKSAEKEQLCTVDSIPASAPTGAEPGLLETPVAVDSTSPFPVAPGDDPTSQMLAPPTIDPLAQDVIEDLPKAKPKAKRKHGSVISMSSNVQSTAGNLLAGFAKAPKSKAMSAPSVIGAPPGNTGTSLAASTLQVANKAKAKAAPSVIGAPPGNMGTSLASSSLQIASKAPSKAAPSVIGAPPVTSGVASTLTAVNPAPPPVAPPSVPNQTEVLAPKANAEGEAIPKRRPKAGQNASKSVVSTNFQSNSAASNLLGPMMARAGKAPGAKRAPADTASAIG